MLDNSCERCTVEERWRQSRLPCAKVRTALCPQYLEVSSMDYQHPPPQCSFHESSANITAIFAFDTIGSAGGLGTVTSATPW